MSTNLTFPRRRPFPFLIKVFASLLCFILLFEQSGFAQIAGQLDLSNSFGNFINSFSVNFSRPPHLRYISYDKFNQSFKIILDKGDTGKINSVGLIDSTREPLKFFYIGLALPNESLWVNLRPDSADDIIDGYLAKTDLGKILLEADLELKKDLARSTFPSTPEGKEYWDGIYRKIEEVYGYGMSNAKIFMNTRIWITPGEIIVCQNQNSAYIYKAGLNVYTEAAYIKNKQGNRIEDERSRIINEYSSELMQKSILPKISKEVNTAKKYAALRQVYYSLILAQWFKRKFYGAGGLYPYLINRRNLTGLTSSKQWSKDAYFKEYRKSYIEKEYDLQVQVFNLFGSSVRTYANGGVDFTGILTGTNPAAANLISSRAFSPPLTRQTRLLAVENHQPTLADPYFSTGSSVTPLPDTVSLLALPVVPGQQVTPAVRVQDFTSIDQRSESVAQPPALAPPYTKQNRQISEIQIDSVIERLQFSSGKYLQKLLNSKRINIRERIRFISDELGFDILNGQGVSLLVRNPDTLRRNREFLRGLALPVNVTNLKSSRKYFVVRELQQIIKSSQWQQLTNEEKLSVVSYLFDLYGLRSSWVTRDNNWDQFLEQFDLQNTPINYSVRAIDFIQQYELARFAKFGNVQQTKDRISKIKEIVQIRGNKVIEFLESIRTPEGFELYIAKRDVNQSEVRSLPLVSQSPHASATINIRLQERLDRAEEDYLRAKKIAEEIKTSLGILESRINKRKTDIKKLTIARQNYLKDGRPAYAKSAERILGTMQDSLVKFLNELSTQQALWVAASRELSSAQTRFEKIKKDISTPLGGRLAQDKPQAFIDRPAVSVYAPGNNVTALPSQDRAEGSGQGTELLKRLEVSLDADLTDTQIQMTLLALINNNPGDDKYERARQIARHIHPDEFKKLRRVASQDESFSGNQRLQERLDSIALERPSELSVELVRAMSKIHDWEEVLKKPDLTQEDISQILQYCERIVTLLPLRLTQETNDSIGTIYRTIKRVHYLIEKTVQQLISQKVNNKAQYEESVRQLLKRGHYFSDYFGALSYLSALNIPKGYIYNFNNGNGNVQVEHKVKYSLWHKLTAVPAMEKNAVSNLKLLLPLLNTEGNECTPEEHYAHLKPTRFGSSELWLLRKPVSIGVSFLILAISVVNLLINGNLSPAAIFMSSLGFIAIPALHFIFAIIGWVKTKSEIKGFHDRIEVIEKSWKYYTPPGDQVRRQQRLTPVLSIASQPVQQQVPLSNDPIEEDRDGEWAMAMRRDAFNNEPEDHGASGIKIRNIGQDALDATTAKPTLVTPKRNAPGGIDFRSIDSAIRYKASTAENINKLNTADRSLNDGVEQDILQINRLIKARIIPSSERLKDCLRKAPASNQQGYNNQINNCLAEIFILEEEYAQPCDASFVDVLRKVVLNN